MTSIIERAIETQKRLWKGLPELLDAADVAIDKVGLAPHAREAAKVALIESVTGIKFDTGIKSLHGSTITPSTIDKIKDRILGIVAAAGDDGVGLKDIHPITTSVDSRARKIIIRDLEASGLVRVKITEGGRVWRLYLPFPAAETK